jgi:hypothetical protein
MTVSTPASEITTLSSQSSPNVPPSLSAREDIIDVTTIRDDSLKVLPLDPAEEASVDNKTNSMNDKEKDSDDDESTVTSSPKTTQLPMTVNLFDTKSKPENDGSDNQAAVPTFDEIDEKNHSGEMMLQEKEGRAINFPLEILNSDQNSSTEHMQINFVTTSTEKTHVMSFFDLSDVSMDHEVIDKNIKEKKKASAAEVASVREKIDVEKHAECSFNGTIYKV